MHEDEHEPIVSAMYEPGSTQHTEAVARAGSQTSPEIMKKVREAAAAESENVSDTNEVDPMMSPEFQGSEDVNAEEYQPKQESATATTMFGSGGRSGGRRARKPSKEVETLMAMGFDQQSCEDALRRGRQPQRSHIPKP